MIAEDDVRAVVSSVPDVLGCHQIRTRGSADHIFMDLHLAGWGHDAPSRPTAPHVVKDRLMSRFPSLQDVVIHIEPPPPATAVHGVELNRFCRDSARLTSPVNTDGRRGARPDGLPPPVPRLALSKNYGEV